MLKEFVYLPYSTHAIGFPLFLPLLISPLFQEVYSIWVAYNFIAFVFNCLFYANHIFVYLLIRKHACLISFHTHTHARTHTLIFHILTYDFSLTSTLRTHFFFLTFYCVILIVPLCMCLMGLPINVVALQVLLAGSLPINLATNWNLKQRVQISGTCSL